MKDVVEGAWGEILQHFPGVALDAFVVMPNHVHGVLVIRDEQAVPVASQHAGKLQNHASLSVIMRSFKAAVTRELRLRGLHDGSAVWQQSYYDRIVRNEGELNRIREYIAYNPIAWRNDAENPDRQADEAYERAWGWLERP